MPKLFTGALAERLNRLCALPVTEATDGMTVRAGDDNDLRLEMRTWKWCEVYTMGLRCGCSRGLRATAAGRAWTRCLNQLRGLSGRTTLRLPGAIDGNGAVMDWLARGQ